MGPNLGECRRRLRFLRIVGGVRVIGGNTVGGLAGIGAGAHERLTRRIWIDPQNVAKDSSQVLRGSGPIISGAISAIARGDVENSVVAVRRLSDGIERQIDHIMKRTRLVDTKDFPRVGVR